MNARLRSIARGLRILVRDAEPWTRVGPLRPPLSERAVRTFERRHRVELPTDYRAFVTTVANGAPGPLGAMPALTKSVDPRHPTHLATPCPLSTADAQRILVVRATEHREYGESCAVAPRDQPLPGVLDVGEWDAGVCAGLVVSGEQRGFVWSIGHYPGWGHNVPLTRRDDELRQLDFLDWYEHWLDASLRPGALHRNPSRPPRGARMLDFSHPVDSELPAWVFTCRELEELQFSHNDLARIPAALGRLTQLRSLDLTGPISGLPESIGRLRRLEHLRLWFSSLRALPKTIGGLPQLRTLDLQSNALTQLPSTIGGLGRLEWLRLSWNKLTSLPASFGGLERLRILELDHNDLTTLPASFAQLASLRSLNLLNNVRLDGARVCAVLAALPELRRLTLPVRTIPRELAKLTQLERLSLPALDDDAGIDDLAELPALCELYVAEDVGPRLQKRLRTMLPGAEVGVT